MSRSRPVEPKDEPIQRLSRALSREFVARLRGWMGASYLLSPYTIAILTGVPRQNLSRWLSGDVRIPAAAADEILDGLRQHAAAVAEAVARIEALRVRFREPDSPEDGLRAEFRARGIRAKATFDAVRAAGFRIVPDAASELPTGSDI